MAFWVSRKEGAAHKGFPGCSTKRSKKLNKRSKNLGMLDGNLVINKMRPQSEPSAISDYVSTGTT